MGIGISGLTLAPDRFDGYTSYDAALAAYRADPDVRILFENGYGAPENYPEVAVLRSRR